jgi:hypothetical protein
MPKKIIPLILLTLSLPLVGVFLNASNSVSQINVNAQLGLPISSIINSVLNVSSSSSIASSQISSSISSSVSSSVSSINSSLVSSSAVNSSSMASSSAVSSSSLSLFNADLGIVKTSSGGATTNTLNGNSLLVGSVSSGSLLTYTTTITNSGTASTSTPITITETVSSLITPQLVSGSNYTSSSDWVCTYSNPTMSCTKSTNLAIGASTQILISYKVS